MEIIKVYFNKSRCPETFEFIREIPSQLGCERYLLKNNMIKIIMLKNVNYIERPYSDINMTNKPPTNKTETGIVSYNGHMNGDEKFTYLTLSSENSPYWVEFYISENRVRSYNMKNINFIEYKNDK